MNIALAFALHICIAALYRSFGLGNSKSGYSELAVYFTGDDVLKNSECLHNA
jgi:hypothetical protein